MEDWIARATNSAKDHTQKDAAAVAKDALRCNRWIASSALQKAVRRGDVALAERAAFALYCEDRSAIWRRLIAIAFEDVGPADLDVILETVAVATLPDWRAVVGEEAVLRSIVSTLATAPKDRSADYLMWIATEHADLREMREICGRASITECLSMVLDRSRSLPDRAVAAWFCSGINHPYQHRVGVGDLAGLADAYCRLGAPPDLVAATVLAAKRTRQPYAVFVPLIWLEAQCSEVSRIEDAIVPPSGLVDGIPLYALDEHTRLGKRAINTLAQQSPSIRACLQQYAPQGRWIAAAQHAAFYAEGSAVSRRLRWSQAQSLEALGIEAELLTAEVRSDGVEPLISAIRGSLDELNAIRTQLLLTVGADAG
jgi:hypothetical protein